MFGIKKKPEQLKVDAIQVMNFRGKDITYFNLYVEFETLQGERVFIYQDAYNIDGRYETEQEVIKKLLS